MTVNPSKSKCITFSGKNKKNNKDTFVIGKNNLDNVYEFTYLGIKIDATGSLKSSIDELTTKANKAKYALNNIAKLKRIPIKEALRLFDSCILPILSYGSEIWVINQTLDCDKWDTTQTEKSHLNFLKHILGVNSSFKAFFAEQIFENIH